MPTKFLVPVILSGGAGTCLWPFSREAHPKPFMRMPDGQTLLHKTYARALAVCPGSTPLTVTNGERLITLQANESTYIPAEHKHRLTNPGQDLLVMIEVQSGCYLGEDDIVRFKDQYGRTHNR
jgi:mannose-1-phosphate guanylyltransferase